MAITDGLLAFWIADEHGSPTDTRVDSTGNGNDLDQSNAETQVAPCTSFAAYFHEGTSQELKRNSTSDLAPSGTFQFGGWMCLSSQAQLGAVIAKEGSTIFLYDYVVHWQMPGATLSFKVRDSGDSSYSSVVWTGTVTQDAWQYVEVYHSGTTIAIRVTQIGGPVPAYVTATGPATIHTGSGKFGMGKHPATGGDHANADRVYNVGLWNRVLSDAESEILAGLNNGNCPPTYPFSTPVALTFESEWEFFFHINQESPVQGANAGSILRRPYLAREITHNFNIEGTLPQAKRKRAKFFAIFGQTGKPRGSVLGRIYFWADGARMPGYVPIRAYQYVTRQNALFECACPISQVGRELYFEIIWYTNDLTLGNKACDMVALN